MVAPRGGLDLVKSLGQHRRRIGMRDDEPAYFLRADYFHGFIRLTNIWKNYIFGNFDGVKILNI